MVGRARIIAEIKRLAAENGGTPMGQERFAEETGISIGSWRGKYWGTWSDAVRDAGFEANRPAEAHTPDALLACLAKLTRQHRRFPTYADVRMAKQADAAFPTHHAFNRLGTKEVRLQMLRSYVAEHADFADVLEHLGGEDADGETFNESTSQAESDGAVYMFKLGKHYKIGKSFSVPRRHREIALELPEKPDVVHVIKTDDPGGIEAYWHTRFASKRTNGEWFALTREDVRAFKRRTFM